MRLRVRLRLSAVAATAAFALFGPSGVRAGAPAFTVSGVTSTLQASSMLVTKFSYVGTSTFTDGSGNSITALEFTLTSATAITALKSFVPCHDVGNGLQLIYVVEANSASATGGVALFATDVAYTDGGGAHAWTVANPPSPGVLDDGVTITGVAMTVVAQSIPSLTLTGQRVYAAFCGSSAGLVTKPPAPSPAAPAGAPAGPSAAPPVTPAPSPDGGPAPGPSAQPAPTASPSPQQTAVPSPAPIEPPPPSPLP